VLAGLLIDDIAVADVVLIERQAMAQGQESSGGGGVARRKKSCVEIGASFMTSIGSRGSAHAGLFCLMVI
jgi:hypothetical protein